MKLRAVLALARVSHLPLIVAQVLAAFALAGAFPSAPVVGLACGALCAMYAGGAFLNDAFDRDLDRVQRTHRPIPSGDVHAATVFDVGFVLLVTGILLIAALAAISGAGWRPVMSAVALGSLIVFYDAHHHDNRWAPLLLGVCHAGIYTTTALLVRRDLCLEVMAGAAAATGYVVFRRHAAPAGRLS
jgi:4-hydroxybenzoate polyprenyltransferase